MDQEHQAPAFLCSESVDRLLPGGGVDSVPSCNSRGLGES